MNPAIRHIALSAWVALVAAGAAGAVTSASAASASAADSSQPSALSDGEIRKVDPDNKKLTIKHGPLQNLDMPGMTMVFQVSDDAMLERLHVGDKVRFAAERVDGKLTVTEIEAVH